MTRQTDPHVKVRDGADHHGYDVYARCGQCRVEIVAECETVTPEIRQSVADAYDNHMCES